jgi:hypothetical protein
VTDGDVVLVDRNCHKSLNYALNLSGAIPVYLMPRRNARGLIGPVPQSEMSRHSVEQKLADSALVADRSRPPVMAALTNSTYDGLCYDVRATTAALSQTVDRIHYDEAWFAYARFNPSAKAAGMSRRLTQDDATVTSSTHKLLAAPAASMIHIRNGKAPVDPALFNEAFMMHTSICAVQQHRVDGRLGEDDGGCRRLPDRRMPDGPSRSGKRWHNCTAKSSAAMGATGGSVYGNRKSMARRSSTPIRICYADRALPGC